MRPDRDPGEIGRPHAPREGDTIGGRYRLVRLLGEGGMGRVFLAQREDLGGQVAIKILREDVELPDTSIERFRREAQAASRLKSESVVRVLDMGTTERGTPFIVMERVVGKTLAKHLADDGPMELARAVDVVIDVCAVLAEAHVRGVFHRDIKPSNIALTTRPDGTELVKVLDFGIAKQTAGEVRALTETATVLGSPKYMSPEHIRDARAAGPLDDLWSLTVLLQEIVTGALPFEAFTIPGLFAKIIADPPTPARSVRPDLPQELEELLLKALAKDPASRFPDAAAFAEALAPFASPDGARRAVRVRPIFAHAARPTVSDPPPTEKTAPEETVGSTELDVTSAPIAREHPPARSEPARSPSAQRLRAIGLVAVGGLALVVIALVWRARPTLTIAPASAAKSAVASSSPSAPPAPVASFDDGAPARSAEAPAVASAEAPLAPATSAPPSPAASAPSSATPATLKRRPAAGLAASSASSSPPRRAAVNDDDFGPRQ